MEKLKQSRTLNGQGSKSGSREKAFQHGSDLCIPGVVTYYIPAAYWYPVAVGDR